MPPKWRVHFAKTQLTADTAGVVFITAFSGLWAPYWRGDVQGTICLSLVYLANLVGITGYTTKSHICRAILESIAFQTKAILDAMLKDSGHKFAELNVSLPITLIQVDGGLSQSQTMMQIQSDILAIPLYRPKMTEITALGAAIAAGIATGVWRDLSEMETALGEVHEEDVFEGRLSDEEREKKWEMWEWGVERSFGWLRDDLESVQNVDESQMD